ILLQDAGDKLDGENQEHLQRIVKSAVHMAALIDDILELSRVSRSDMRLDEVNLSGICLELRKTFIASTPERRVEWNIQPGLVARGDYQLLYVTMSNLLSNAWKFTQHQSPAQIEFGLMDKAGENVYYVRDNGVGFDMKYSEKMFGLFQRLHRSDEYEGTGVGLATVERILTRHNGWVRAEGEVGKGATVYFSLPEKTDSIKPV
ncbi:MAG TPA: ATP-binding protein, partial [Gammaproteobacteria bacterium]